MSAGLRGNHQKAASDRVLGVWVPALTLPALAITLASSLPGWVYMWLVALGLFAGAKWITIQLFLVQAHMRGRVPIYLFLWPGLNARAFLGGARVCIPEYHEWILAIFKTVCGAVVLWGLTRLVGAGYPLLTGWSGMLGVVLILHFGVFHLLSLIWRAHGINAQPIMRAPGTATALSRFWGGAWNTAFSDLMHEHCFKPLARRVEPQIACMVVFALSGLLHELVISLPARGGYGLPTAYFLVQGLGVLVEHSALATELGLGAGWKGRVFVACVAGLPALWLFHPKFIHGVILPMLSSIGAT